MKKFVAIVGSALLLSKGIEANEGIFYNGGEEALILKSSRFLSPYEKRKLSGKRIFARGAKVYRKSSSKGKLSSNRRSLSSRKSLSKLRVSSRQRSESKSRARLSGSKLKVRSGSKLRSKAKLRSLSKKSLRSSRSKKSTLRSLSRRTSLSKENLRNLLSSLEKNAFCDEVGDRLSFSLKKNLCSGIRKRSLSVRRRLRTSERKSICLKISRVPSLARDAFCGNLLLSRASVEKKTPKLQARKSIVRGRSKLQKRLSSSKKAASLMRGLRASGFNCSTSSCKGRLAATRVSLSRTPVKKVSSERSSSKTKSRQLSGSYRSAASKAASLKGGRTLNLAPIRKDLMLGQAPAESKKASQQIDQSAYQLSLAGDQYREGNDQNINQRGFQIATKPSLQKISQTAAQLN